MELADKLTNCVQQIIDFSKMVPGFMQLLQDDQISLLKSGSYGIMLLYAAQTYFPERNSFIYNQQLLNVDQLLIGNGQLDEEERYFIQENLDFIRQLKQFNLSSTEMAILSAIILFNPENMSLNDHKSIYHTHQKFIEILRMDMENNRANNASGMSRLEKQQMFQQLLNLVTDNVRRLTQSHFELIKSFKIKNCHVEFPPLHRELFNVEYYVYQYKQQMQQLQQQQQQQQQQIHLPIQPLASNQSNHFNHQQQSQQHSQQVHAYNGLSIKQVPSHDNLNLSSPSSCSSTSSASSSACNQPPTTLSPPLSHHMQTNQQQQQQQQQHLTYDQYYNYNQVKGGYYQTVQPAQMVTTQVGTPTASSSSPSSSASSTSSSTYISNADYSQVIDESSLGLIKQETVTGSNGSAPVAVSSASNASHSPSNSLNKVNSITLLSHSAVSSLPANTTVNAANLSPSSSISSSSSVSPPSYASLTSTYASLIKSEPLFNSNSMSIGIDTV